MWQGIIIIPIIIAIRTGLTMVLTLSIMILFKKVAYQ